MQPIEISPDKMTDITQDNLYLLLPSKVSRVAEMLMEDDDISVVDAVAQIYRSQMYRQLEQEHTKLWHLGSVDLYAETKNNAV